MTMARAFLIIHLTVAAAVLASASAASAAGDAGRKSGNTFVMVTTATAPGSRVVTPSAGASVAPKAVVSNPHNVPLLQNTSSLRAVR
jgi:hypothetical protein